MNLSYYDDLIALVQKSLELVKFREAIREAKEKSPQSFIFHSISVGTLSLAILDEIRNIDKDGVALLEHLYNIDYKSLAFFGGFFHDWMKLFSEKEEYEYKIPKEAINKAKEIAKMTGLPNSDKFIDVIANFAEGPLTSNEEIPLWASVKIADMLMISTIRGVNDVLYYAERMNYKDAIKRLSGYNLKLSYLQASPRLFTSIVSEEIIQAINGRPLISYHDGIIFLSRGSGSNKINLSTLYNILSSKLKGGSKSGSEYENGREYKSIVECIKNKEEEWRRANLGDFSVFYDENKNPKQLNAFLHTSICKYYEDIVSLLDNKGKIEVARKIIEDFRNDLPYAVIAYFFEKFSSDKSSKGYIKKYMNVKERFPNYLKTIDKDKALNKILEAIEKRYSSDSNKIDLTLVSIVKKAFNGDIVNDLPPIEIEPKNYCIVCGAPIYGESASFGHYGFQLKGKKEIWIPREKAMADIDNESKRWVVCPICNYEAKLMSEELNTPFIIVSFYPGVPVDLLKILDFLTSTEKLYFIDVINNEKFSKIFSNAGGSLAYSEKKIHPDYLGSKIVIPANLLNITTINTRLTKEVLNGILPEIPSISISFLASPIYITANVYDFPLQSKYIEVSSDINYLWLKNLNNERLLIQLLAYKAKYLALTKAIKDKDDRRNYLNSMISDMDRFAEVDSSLSVIALGMAINEESSFLKSLLPYTYFLNQAFGRVSKMGETFSKSLYVIAKTLTEIIKEENPSKHQIVGFFRDGRDMFFKSSLAELNKDDRVGIATNAALASLQNKYDVNDKQMVILFSNLRDVFSLLYDIESKTDRSLSLSISNALANWLYVLFESIRAGENSE
ncbi:CRISPR-associated protein [Sulfolobus tengchongensis]|uniref:CRISPR-associated protein n=1 Tax=Sulfolobus tengchongensis TaxID=207809 RepID=A0AAX4L3B4_9CREN